MKLLVLGACCSGKSTLAEHLRLRQRNVIECDEAVMVAAGGMWPASAEENRRLVVEAAKAAVAMPEVIFLTSWMPTDLLRLARARGFRVALLSVPMPELERRNRERVASGASSDVAHWFEPQLANYDDLTSDGLIDVALDGTLTTEELAARLARL